MPFDVVEHFPGSKELRITADDGFAFLAVIGIENEIPQKLCHTVFRKSTGNHGEQRTDAVGHLVRIVCLVPCVVIGIGREDAAHLGIGTITDYRQEAILHQLGNS